MLTSNVPSPSSLAYNSRQAYRNTCFDARIQINGTSVVLTCLRNLKAFVFCRAYSGACVLLCVLLNLVVYAETITRILQLHASPQYCYAQPQNLSNLVDPLEKQNPFTSKLKLN